MRFRRAPHQAEQVPDPHSENGEIIWLEVNTQPGMTPTSLAPELALNAGHSFGEFVSWIVEDASCQR